MKVLLSVRYDITDASTNNDFDLTDSLPAEAVTQDDDRFTPRFGLNYEFTPWLAIFGSYAESFSDSTFGTLANGAATEPEQATPYEVGLKGRWFDGRLNATLAAFQLTKENLTADLPNSAFVSQTGEARSRGLEFDLSGRLNDHLSIIATYAYLDTEITHDSDFDGGPGNTGHRLPNAPEHSGSLWLKYDFLNGFALGAGGIAMSEREGDFANSNAMHFDTLPQAAQAVQRPSLIEYARRLVAANMTHAERSEVTQVFVFGPMLIAKPEFWARGGRL